MGVTLSSGGRAVALAPMRGCAPRHGRLQPLDGRGQRDSAVAAATGRQHRPPDPDAGAAGHHDRGRHPRHRRGPHAGRPGIRRRSLRWSSAPSTTSGGGASACGGSRRRPSGCTVPVRRVPGCCWPSSRRPGPSRPSEARGSSGSSRPCLRSPELPPLVRQHRVFDGRGRLAGILDLAFPSLRLGVEAHSRQFHFGRLPRAGRRGPGSSSGPVRVGGALRRMAGDQAAGRPAGARGRDREAPPFARRLRRSAAPADHKWRARWRTSVGPGWRRPERARPGRRVYASGARRARAAAAL